MRKLWSKILSRKQIIVKTSLHFKIASDIIQLAMTEQDRPEAQSKQILDNPGALIEEVRKVVNGQANEEDLRTWLGEQWEEISAKLSPLQFELVIRPYNGSPSGIARSFKPSDQIEVTEHDLPPSYGRIQVDVRDGPKYMPRTNIQFRVNPEDRTDLRRVLVEERVVIGDILDGNLKVEKFDIQVGEQLQIRKMARNEMF